MTRTIHSWEITMRTGLVSRRGLCFGFLFFLDLSSRRVAPCTVDEDRRMIVLQKYRPGWAGVPLPLEKFLSEI